MKHYKGVFITLEGSEGVGKTSSLKFVEQQITALGHDVVTTREPGGTELAEQIRGILLAERQEPVESKTELLMMFAARYQHVTQVIKPALERGQWVICDRFVDASYAYQGGGRGIQVAQIEQLEHWCLEDFKPDLTLLLDMSVEEGLERTKKRGKADRFETEQLAFYENIRTAYLNRAKKDPQRMKIIDAAPSMQQVQKSIQQQLKSFVESYATPDL
ncbi:MAG: dTMP kinase [Enterobacterales bacterium]|nr:dTMP kinase [Enterobacterales bacterium]